MSQWAALPHKLSQGREIVPIGEDAQEVLTYTASTVVLIFFLIGKPIQVTPVTLKWPSVYTEIRRADAWQMHANSTFPLQRVA